MMGVAGPPVVTTKIIDIPSIMTDREGKKFLNIMSDVTLVPSRRYNLFSVTKLMKNSWALEGRINTEIMLKRDRKEVHLRERMHTIKRVLFVARIKKRVTKGAKMGLVSVVTGPGSREPKMKGTRNQGQQKREIKSRGAGKENLACEYSTSALGAHQ